MTLTEIISVMPLPERADDDALIGRFKDARVCSLVRKVLQLPHTTIIAGWGSSQGHAAVSLLVENLLWE
jgi:hypothetical protein